MVYRHLVSNSVCLYPIIANYPDFSNPLHLSIDSHYTAFGFYYTDDGNFQQQFFMHVYNDLSADIGPDERRRIQRSDLYDLYYSEEWFIPPFCKWLS